MGLEQAGELVWGRECSRDFGTALGGMGGGHTGRGCAASGYPIED